MHLNHQTFKRVNKHMLVTSYFNQLYSNLIQANNTDWRRIDGNSCSDEINGRTVKHM
jgi:hypothetical protein